MPYINQQQRHELDSLLILRSPSSAGELNYKITQLLDEYLKFKGLNYENLNVCIGALECAKLELYRRVAAPYEDKKIAKNGDVYTVKL